MGSSSGTVSSTGAGVGAVAAVAAVVAVATVVGVSTHNGVVQRDQQAIARAQVAIGADFRPVTIAPSGYGSIFDANIEKRLPGFLQVFSSPASKGHAPGQTSGDDLTGGTSLGPGTLGGDAVHGGGALGDLDAGVGDPGTLDDRPAGHVDQADVRGDDAGG
ncbi:hypothetical protein IAE22_28790, partial [Bacillus sp. S34]|nr:hypothetical protein [Bacillus sp. S34]